MSEHAPALTTGQRIKQRRKELGMSAEKLADYIGVSHATMYRYENGDIERVTTARLAQIAETLGVTPEFLLVGYDAKESEAHHLNQLSARPELLELLATAEALTEEQVLQLISIARVLK